MLDPTPVPVAAPSESIAPVAPAPLPPTHWSKKSVKQLLAVIDGAAAEGLRPADYRRDEIAAIVAAGDEGPGIDATVETAARALAHDYAVGRADEHARVDWHIGQSPAALMTLDRDLDAAVADNKVQKYLTGLLPQDARYAALRDALAETPATQAQRVVHIRASMERWRWMPRALGANYVWVNVPAYQLTLFRENDAVATHDVVVGAKKTPTPMLAAYANSIVVNPWWTLPPSVLAEGKRYSPAKGYVYQRAGGRTVIRQKPGPQNALGRLKVDMPNEYAIYLHDTPSKAGFAKADRALSHGCIRVKDIESFAGQLDEVNTVETALADPATQTLQLQKSVPVYIVYFTAGASADGRVVTFADPYGRDGALLAALDGPAGGTSLASAAP